MQMIRHCIDQCWDVLQTVSDPEIRFIGCRFGHDSRCRD